MDSKKYEMIQKENEGLIEEFGNHLQEKGLSDKTIRTHINNVAFYLNRYLLDHYDDANAIKGIEYFYIDDFFGYFFIRKCMWSTPSTIRTTAASLKRFYRFMYETNRVTKNEYEEFTHDLQESLDDWCEDCRIFNDGKEYINF